MRFSAADVVPEQRAAGASGRVPARDDRRARRFREIPPADDRVAHLDVVLLAPLIVDLDQTFAGAAELW